MTTLLIVLTLIEVLVLVVVLATYLVVIAAKLRDISKTLGLVTFGVRAIEKQTEPIGPVVADINGALEQVAGALEQVTGGGTDANQTAPPATAPMPSSPPEQPATER